MAANIPPLKKKKWYAQNFTKDWTEDPELKNWLRQDAKNLEDCYCVCCEVQLKKCKQFNADCSLENC